MFSGITALMYIVWCCLCRKLSYNDSTVASLILCLTNSRNDQQKIVLCTTIFALGGQSYICHHFTLYGSTLCLRYYCIRKCISVSLSNIALYGPGYWNHLGEL